MAQDNEFLLYVLLEWANDRHEKKLVRVALKDSEDLIREIDIARDHIERVFRVQIASNAQGAVAEEDYLARDFILWRLQSLKTDVQVSQFFPRCYFRDGFGRDFELENPQTFTTLRAFTTKYTRTSVDTSWATQVFTEIESYQKYDAPDFRDYLAKKLKEIDRKKTTTSASSQTSLETTQTSSESPVMTASTASGTVTPSPRNSDTLVAKPPSMNSTKSKFKLKNIFNMGKKKVQGSDHAQSDFRRGNVCEKTKALLSKHSGVVPGDKTGR